MFDSLPEILGRRFLVSHLLPAAVFVAGLAALLAGPGAVSSLLAPQQTGPLSELGFLVAIFAVGVLLLAFNRSITRFLEGYGSLNPLRAFKWIEVLLYERRTRKEQELDREIGELKAANNPISAEHRARKNRLRMQKVLRFPDDPRWLLPTSFGNTIRAFEVYSRSMYGIDAIPGWFRLAPLLPAELVAGLDDAKAQVDLWMNLCVTAAIVLLLAGLGHFAPELLASTAFAAQELKARALPTGAVSSAVAVVAYLRAVRAAEQWGHWVKSAFDLHRGDLAAALGLAGELSVDDGRAFFVQFSRAFIYEDPELLTAIERRFSTWKALRAAKEEGHGEET